MTETWTKLGDVSAFTELLPPQCSFLSTPRTSGRGGGVATVFKDNFKCKPLQVNNYTCFEVQLFSVELACPVLFAVVYRPPKYSKDFIQEFSEFLAEVVSKHDQLLICGDFNIHVCCPSDPLANDFKRLLSSFDLNQAVNGPTHKAGHTLDLIISYGLSVSLTEICDTAISDHLPIIFDFPAPPPSSKPPAPPSRHRIITSSTAEEFATAFINQSLVINEYTSSGCPNELLSSFSERSTAILDSIAPFKRRSTKPKADPWLNDTTRTLRQQCRQAERRWKKDKLHVSLQILRDSLAQYQRAVKEAKSRYLSDIISSNGHCPRVLFNTINSVICANTTSLVEASAPMCEKFLHYFVNKVVSVRQLTG